MPEIYIIQVYSLNSFEFFLMITHQQVIALLQHLEQQHPQAFKHNFLFYSMLKTKGVLDEPKEIIPWLLAVMIFVSSSIVLSDSFKNIWQNLTDFQYMGLAILSSMLLMQLYLPVIIWQIKHSSESMYQHLKNTPLKLGIVIILQTLNLLYIHSSILQYFLFFLALSFGFVRLYKESMFLDKTSLEQRYYLQQIRRATFWAYKQQLKFKLQLKYQHKSNQEMLKKQQHYFSELHNSLKSYENKMCNVYKYQDIESYMDDISK